MWTLLLLLLLSWNCCGFSLPLLLSQLNLHPPLSPQRALIGQTTPGLSNETAPPACPQELERFLLRDLCTSCVFWEADSCLIWSDQSSLKFSRHESLFPTASDPAKLQDGEEEAPFRQWVSERGRTTSRATHERAVGEKEEGGEKGEKIEAVIRKDESELMNENTWRSWYRAVTPRLRHREMLYDAVNGKIKPTTAKLSACDRVLLLNGDQPPPRKRETQSLPLNAQPAGRRFTKLTCLYTLLFWWVASQSAG